MLVEVDYRKYVKACVLDTSVSPVSAWPRGMGVSPVEGGGGVCWRMAMRKSRQGDAVDTRRAGFKSP